MRDLLHGRRTIHCPTGRGLIPRLPGEAEACPTGADWPAPACRSARPRGRGGRLRGVWVPTSSSAVTKKGGSCLPVCYDFVFVTAFSPLPPSYGKGHICPTDARGLFRVLFVS